MKGSYAKTSHLPWTPALLLQASPASPTSSVLQSVESLLSQEAKSYAPDTTYPPSSSPPLTPFFTLLVRAREMADWAKALATKLDDLGLILATHTMKESQFLKVLPLSLFFLS